MAKIAILQMNFRSALNVEQARPVMPTQAVHSQRAANDVESFPY